MSETFTNNHAELEEAKLVAVKHWEYPTKFVPEDQLDKFLALDWELVEVKHKKAK